MQSNIDKSKLSFSARLNDVWAAAKLEPSTWGYCSAWVMKFGKFLTPRLFNQATLADVEAFYVVLVQEARAAWQVEQADAALMFVFHKLYPRTGKKGRAVYCRFYSTVYRPRFG